MLFFSKKRDESGLSKECINFLNAVDYEYMRAFSTRSMRTLNTLLTRECAINVSRLIFAVNSRYFGAEKFRTTSWTVMQEEETFTRVLKDVVFDKVKVAGSLYIDIADNYREVWELDTSEKELKIRSIQSYAEYKRVMSC